MRAFVTGADGFAGQWLLRRLLRDGAEVTGMTRAPHPVLTTLEHAQARRIAWHCCDVSDADGVRRLVRACKPDLVFHLAAQTSVPASMGDPLGTLQTNVLGTAYMLEAVRWEAPAATVVVAGSADAYGAVSQDELPLRETAPLRPTNPYAASKAAAECITLQYARAGWAKTIATRSFNHTGPGQSPNFAIASFAKQIAAIRSGRQTAELHVGNLAPRRDVCDVRDVVDAYVGLAQRGRVGTAYNVCCGTDMSMREVVDQLLRLARVRAELREDPERIRIVDSPVLRGDPALIQRDAGWKASTPAEQTLTDMLEYYSRVAA